MSSSRSTGRPGRQLVARLGLVLASLLLAIGLAEIALRLVAPSAGAPRLPLSYDHEAIDRLAAGDAYVTFDPDLGWTPTPNADRMGGDVRYRHNADGLRADRSYSPYPPPGKYRIAAYGDSFTYCEEVDYDDCWTKHLEELLDRSEVLNFGAPGYAPDQAWLRYQRDGPTWHPCAVLIGTMVENINRMVNRFRPFYYPDTGIPLAKPRFVLGPDDRPTLLPSPAREADSLQDPAWVEANLGPRDAFFFAGTFVRNPLDRLALVSLARTAVYRRDRQAAVDWTPAWAAHMYSPGNEAYEVLLATLVGFAEQVRADHATPVVVIFPFRGEVEAARNGEPLPQAPLVQALEERGVATIDLSDALGQQAHRSSIGNLVVDHYRPLGNTVVSRALDVKLPRLIRETCGNDYRDTGR